MSTQPPADPATPTPPADPPADPPKATPPADPTTPTPPADPPAAADALAAAQQTIAELTAKLEAKLKEDADPAERLATLTERVEALTGELATTQTEAREAARMAALERLGVLPEYHAAAPSVDARTAEGKAKLEEWAAKRPAMLRSRSPEPPTAERASSILGKEGRGNLFTSPASIQRNARRNGL